MLKLAAIFSDNMVLQRNKNVAVWGTSDSDNVTVTIQNHTVTATVKKNEWSVFLPPMTAGGPYKMTISDNKNDTITYENIMIGEVWLAGGQSNMELELQNSKDGQNVVASANDKNVRFYYTPKFSYIGEELLTEEEKSSWELCTPDTCGRWSAVGYYYAKKLAEKLGVTVGIIGCNWGGTSASCWISRKFLEQETLLSSYLTEYDEATKGQNEEEYIKAYEDYKIYQAEFDKNVGEYYQTNPNPTWEEAIRLYGENQYPGPMGPRNETRPYGLYETMLKRVMPYTLAGFIYYQGEEDDHKPYTYDTLLATLIRQWRYDWNDDTLPFLLVQLPVFQNDGEPDYKNWAFIREAQMKTYRTVKNTGIAVILEKGDYGNIHPTEKETVGNRLAMQALYHVYHTAEEKDAFGPLYKNYFVTDNKLHVIFDHVYDGIICKKDSISGFEIAGDDKVYYPATASLQALSDSSNECEIILTSDSVEKPLYARYCWTNYCEVSLFGGNYIPAAPFRTDIHDGAVATGSRKGFVC